jgi:hypothetical protein
MISGLVKKVINYLILGVNLSKLLKRVGTYKKGVGIPKKPSHTKSFF